MQGSWEPDFFVADWRVRPAFVAGQPIPEDEPLQEHACLSMQSPEAALVEFCESSEKPGRPPRVVLTEQQIQCNL
jgi:hypothetical protein